LELDVKAEGLASIRWDGILCDKLLDESATKAASLLFPEARYYFGEFGIYCNGGTVTVTTARYLTTE
jgi:hypothetical protein